MDATTRPLARQRPKRTKRKPTAPTARAKDPQRYTRSRITNHVDLLPDVDGNSSQARRFRDLVLALISDSGTLDMCSEIRLGLIRRLASITVKSEWLEAAMLNGEAVDTQTLCQLASTALRLSARLGLDRVQRQVGPTLSDILRADAAGQRERHVEGSPEIHNGFVDEREDASR
jgi:hypothetical protein